jgi:hypothetical protein
MGATRDVMGVIYSAGRALAHSVTTVPEVDSGLSRSGHFSGIATNPANLCPIYSGGAANLLKTTHDHSAQ